MDNINKFSYFLRLVFFGTLITLFINVILVDFIKSIDNEAVLSVDFLKNFSFKKQILIVVFIGPLFETFIFQFLPIRILSLFNIKFISIFSVIISAILFSLNHSYSIAYQMVTLVIGLSFASIYVMGFRKAKIGFISTLSVHILNNAIVFFDLI